MRRGHAATLRKLQRRTTRKCSLRSPANMRESMFHRSSKLELRGHVSCAGCRRRRSSHHPRRVCCSSETHRQIKRDSSGCWCWWSRLVAVVLLHPTDEHPREDHGIPCAPSSSPSFLPWAYHASGAAQYAGEHAKITEICDVQCGRDARNTRKFLLVTAQKVMRASTRSTLCISDSNNSRGEAAAG